MSNKSKIYIKYERYKNASSNLNSILECKTLTCVSCWYMEISMYEWGHVLTLVYILAGYVMLKADT